MREILSGPELGISTASKTTDGPCVSPLVDHTTRKDDKGDQPTDEETTWTNTGGARPGRLGLLLRRQANLEAARLRQTRIRSIS